MKFFRTFLLAFCYNIIIFNYISEILDFFGHIPGYAKKEHPEISDILEVIILGVSLAFFLPSEFKKPSQVIIWFLYLTHFVPTIYQNIFIFYNIEFSILIWFEFLVLLLLYRLTFQSQEISSEIKEEPKVLPWIQMVLLAAANFYIFSALGFKINLTDIYEVYGIRAEFKDYVAEIKDPIIPYLILIFPFSVASFSLLNSLVYFKWNPKNLIIIFLSFFICFQVFQNAGFKSIALTPIFVIILYFIFKWTKNNMVFFLWALLLLFLILPLFTDLSRPVYFTYYHAMRRIFLASGLNVNYFYDYLKNMPVGYYSDTPYFVSMIYFKTPGSANTGFLGDAFGKFYPVGLFFFYAILIFIFKVLDIIANEKNNSFIFALSIIYSYLIINSSLTTVLVSYGLLLLLILLIVRFSSFKVVLNQLIKFSD